MRFGFAVLLSHMSAQNNGAATHGDIHTRTHDHTALRTLEKLTKAARDNTLLRGRDSPQACTRRPTGKARRPWRVGRPTTRTPGPASAPLRPLRPLSNLLLLLLGGGLLGHPLGVVDRLEQ